MLRASDFQMQNDFLAPQLKLEGSRKGSDFNSLKKLPPQNITQLIAQTRGEKTTPLPPPQESKPAPTIFVQSPKTGDKLAEVHVHAIASPVGDEEILAEAHRLTQLNLPAQALVPVGGETEGRPAILEKKTLLPERLKLKARGDRLEIFPQALNLLIGSQALDVEFDPALTPAPQIFLRESRVMRWDAANKQLLTVATGRSEIFITYRNQMYILPVEVVKPSRTPLLGDNPRVLEQLTSVLALQSGSYTYQSPMADSSNMPREASKPLTLAHSAAEVDATRIKSEQQRQQFVFPEARPDYRSVAIQVLDERSLPEQSLLYPVSGVTVRLFGTQIVARTDAKGHALFGEFPLGSRFWAAVQDEKGLIVPTVSELTLPRGSKSEVLRMRTMNFRTYYAYQNILEIAQDAQLGSICGRAMNRSGSKPLEGIRVGLNVDADGPFYIGQFGPQRDLQATDRSGRFCFFNVRPGLTEMSFYVGSQYLTALALPVFPGAHSEEDLALENSPGGQVFLAALPTAIQQIYDEGAETSDLFQPVDAADMLAIGENETLTKVSPGILGLEAGYTNYKGRIYMLAQAPEFESVLYAFDRDKEWAQHLSVVPLLQRGFIEDLFHEMNLQDNRDSIAFDPALGHALVYHTLEKNTAGVKISLIDSYGRQHDDAWYFGNPKQGNSKAAFFNLQPGVYQVKVEGTDGSVISLDTLGVDFWTTALVQTGSTAQFSLRSRRDEDEAGTGE